ncbi:MAG TPA: orotidine-5'-phosphate decarboxylase [Acidimicrobiia bacterium]|nr:orotidine-5'-phosphate decarboxylase [Acidimicrobiia bacterium]
MTFFEALEERSRAADSLLCVGVDPRARDAVEARRASLDLIEDTAPMAAAFKMNAAFFEAHGPAGVEALVEVVTAVPDEIPVILDAKRGDIAATAVAYAEACFAVIGAGAVTLSPYLGRDAIEPFLAHPGTGVFVLCRTSNPSAAQIQDDTLDSGQLVYEHIAQTAATWAGPDRLGLVVGSTQPEALARVRALVPEHWILAPGVGPQGGDVEAVGVALRSDGRGVLVPSSRLVGGAADPAAMAADLRDALRSVKSRPAQRPRRGLAVDLHASGCVRLGEFTLRSGVVSPIYVDLRRLSSRPGLMRRVAASYGSVLARLTYDHVGAVPYGALPLATAVALDRSRSLVWPRRESKEHGTGARVEGEWAAGDRVVLVDDVVTSGISALEAAGLLREVGLVVEDLVVLIERDPAARAALADEGIELHAITTLERLVDDLGEAGAIGEDERRTVAAFLAAR